jgi:uncharacterized protein YkwD
LGRRLLLFSSSAMKRCPMQRRSRTACCSQRACVTSYSLFWPHIGQAASYVRSPDAAPCSQRRTLRPFIPPRVLARPSPAALWLSMIGTSVALSSCNSLRATSQSSATVRACASRVWIRLARSNPPGGRTLHESPPESSAVQLFATRQCVSRRKGGSMSMAQGAFLAGGFYVIGFVAGVCETPRAYAQSKREGSRLTATGPAAQAIIAITNRERIQRNLKPLKADRACTLAITGHVKDMARARYLSHQGRDGRGASERYRQYKPAGRGAGENIAYNTHGTGESFMRQWLRSPGHRGNILSPVYKGIGVSVQATCSARQAGGRCYYYAGQCFSP